MDTESTPKDFNADSSDSGIDAFDLDWKNPPKLTDLTADYSEAQSFKANQVGKIQGYRKAYEANVDFKAEAGRSSIQPMLVRKQAEWQYAPLSEPFLSSDSIFEVSPRTFEDKKAAEQNQILLNYQFNTKINKVKFIDEFIRSNVDEGVCFIKLGWIHEEEEREVEVPIMGMVPVQDPAMAQQMMQQGIEPVEEGIVDYALESQTITTKNHPTVEICDVEAITVDPSCDGVLEDASFIIHTYESSLSELKKDGRYKNLDDIPKDQTSPLEQSDKTFNNTSDFTFSDEPRKRLMLQEYWGYWDIHGDSIVVPILAVWCGSTLIRMEENPYPDKSIPFVSSSYMPVKNNLYGQADAELLIDNQKVIGAITRGAIDLMGKSANSQIGMRKDALDAINRKRYRKGQDYEFNTHIDPRQAIHMHTYPEIPNSVLTMLQMETSEAEAISGIKAFNGNNTTLISATESRNAMTAGSQRKLAILRRLAKCITEMGRKIIAMNAVFLDEEEVIRVTNSEFIRVDRADLQGDIDLRLNISTAESDNEKAQELSFMLQTLGNSIPLGITQKIMADVAKLRKMPELAQSLLDYAPEPDPLAQEKAQLENDLIRAQIAYENSRAAENGVDMQVKTAKARNIDSTSDLQDLDFLDKQSGAAEEKEARKLASQSQIKLDEKAGESMLDFNKTRALSAALPQTPPIGKRL